METNVNNLYVKVTSKKNDFNAKLNKLNDNIKKIDKYIKENNDKKS